MTTTAEKTEPAGPTVFVACRLPAGLLIELVDKKTKQTEGLRLLGRKHSKIVGAPYGTTTAPKAFMDEWMKRHKHYPAVTSGAIFMANDLASLEAMYLENEKRRTGFEQAPQEIKELGIQKVKSDD